MSCLIIIDNSGVNEQIQSARMIKNIIENVNNLKCNIINKRQYKEYITTFFKIKVFIDHIVPGILKSVQSEYNIFIPNIDVLEEWDVKFMRFMDYIISKTKITHNLLTSIYEKEKVLYTKFAFDQDFDSNKDYDLIGHFPEESPFKGTHELMKIWIQNKGFNDINSNLKLIIIKKFVSPIQIEKRLQHFTRSLKWSPTDRFGKNGRRYGNMYFYEELPKFQYDRVVKKAGIHVYPSLCEGDCYYINKGRSTKSIVITTDAEPMNELIKNKNQLIKVSSTGYVKDVINNKYVYQKNTIKVNYVDMGDFKNKLILNLKKINTSLGESNYKEYIDEYKYFSDKFSNLINEFKLKQLSTGNIFDRIYKYQLWKFKNAPLSGEGSTLMATKETVNIITSIIKKYKIRSFYDSACGDMTWMPIILRQFPDLKYYGGDVSKYVISLNKKRDDLKKHEFNVIDFTKDKLPKVDLILCRDVLQHLDTEKVLKGLENFSKSGAQFLLATNYLKTSKEESEKNIMSGYTVDRNLYHPPINLKEAISCYDEKYGGKYLCLWKLPLYD